MINKYQNTAELPLECLKEFIREQGYGYILDLVVQEEENVKLLWYMLVLIHQLKGSKEGLLLVLSLFEDNFDPSQTTISQWYETIPVGTPNTFTLETSIDIAKLGEDFFTKFQTFLANYVYPEMLSLRVNYNVDGRITYRPYGTMKVSLSNSLSSNDSFNCGSADDTIVRDLYDCGTASSEANGEYADGNVFYLAEAVITPIYDASGNIIDIQITGTKTETINIDANTTSLM